MFKLISSSLPSMKTLQTKTRSTLCQTHDPPFTPEPCVFYVAVIPYTHSPRIPLRIQRNSPNDSLYILDPPSPPTLNNTMHSHAALLVNPADTKNACPKWQQIRSGSFVNKYLSYYCLLYHQKANILDKKRFLRGHRLCANVPIEA